MTYTTSKINLEVLETAVNDYFYREEELKIFLKTCNIGFWECRTPKEREDYIEYSERNQGAWNAVQVSCELLNIDSGTLLAVVKAFNRFTRNGGKWDRYMGMSKLNYSQKDKLLNLISK